MLAVLVVVVSIGVVDSANPSTIGPALYLASGGNGVRSVLEFTLGAFVVYFLAGVILTLGPGQLLLSLVPRPRPHTQYIIELVVGAALALGGAIVWRRRGPLARRKLSSAGTGRRSSFLLGASIMVVEVPTAFPYFAAIAAIIGSGLGIGAQLILLGVFNACFVLPLLVIAAMLALGGNRARRLLSAGRAALKHHWPQVLAVALVLAGAFVTTLGATGLLGTERGHFARSARQLHRLLKP
jgi:cytochrome c biogenesis protein CcdA